MLKLPLIEHDIHSCWESTKTPCLDLILTLHDTPEWYVPVTHTFDKPKPYWMVHLGCPQFGLHALIHFFMEILHHFCHCLSLSDYLLSQEVEPRGRSEIVWVLDRQKMKLIKLGRLGEWISILCVNLLWGSVRNIVRVIYMTFPWLTDQGWPSLLLSVFIFLVPCSILLIVECKWLRVIRWWKAVLPSTSQVMSVKILQSSRRCIITSKFWVWCSLIS